MKIQSITDLSSSASTKLPGKGKEVDAAKQFEALLIGQMLKSMRESGSGWLGSGEDQASESAIGMAEEHFAAALSSSGGFGIAQTIQRGLSNVKHPQKLQE